MEKQAALDEASRLNREATPGGKVHWSVREVDGDWQVVSFEAPGRERPDLKPSVGTKPVRPDPDELQPPAHNPYWGTV